MDYVLGSDANNGSSWALAKKTINGYTAAILVPGDVIRIAKSPDTTSLGITATWTNLSRAVTLASTLTLNIDTCEAAWTASANVTATTSTTAKEGTNACSLAIADPFTTGLVAFDLINVGGIDFSAYQQVSFWIRSSVAIAAGVLTLDLCSDVAGVVSVNSIAIPGIPGVDRWQIVTVNTGGALGNAIKSISVNAISDPGTPIILIDNILACKASGSADSLTLSSLISKNSASQGGIEGFYGIKSINGTAIQLDNDTNSLTGTGQGYSGTTETVTTYKRETIKTNPGSATTTIVQQVQDSGTIGNNIEFQGGWDKSTTIQNGETYFSGQNGNGFGIYLSGISYTTLNYLNVIRYAYGINYNNTSNNNTIIILSNANNNFIGVYYSNLSNNNTLTILYNGNNNSSIGVAYDGISTNNNITTIYNCNNNTSYGVSIVNNIIIINIYNANNNGVCGIRFNGTNTIIKSSLSTSGNGLSGIILNNSNFCSNYIRNAVITEAVECSGYLLFSNSKLFSQNHDNTANNHWIFTDGGTINSQTAVRHTASGIAWMLSPTSTNRASNYPLDLSISKIAVSANNLVTVQAWFRRDNVGITGQLICKGRQIAGVDNNVTASMTALANTWEKLSITFTPTEAGVIEIMAYAYGGTTYNIYVDDMTIIQV